MEENDFLSKMMLIPVHLPKEFLQIAKYTGAERFVGVWYGSKKPMWNDGRQTRFISYRKAYVPFVHHPLTGEFVIANDGELGSIVRPTKHALIIDRSEEKLYMSEIETAKELLAAQITERELQGNSEGLKKAKIPKVEQITDGEIEQKIKAMRDFMDQQVMDKQREIERLADKLWG